MNQIESNFNDKFSILNNLIQNISSSEKENNKNYKEITKTVNQQIEIKIKKISDDLIIKTNQNSEKIKELETLLKNGENKLNKKLLTELENLKNEKKNNSDFFSESNSFFHKELAREPKENLTFKSKVYIKAYAKL